MNQLSAYLRAFRIAFLATVAQVESSSTFAMLRSTSCIVWHPQKILLGATLQEKLHRMFRPKALRFTISR